MELRTELARYVARTVVNNVATVSRVSASLFLALIRVLRDSKL